MHGTRPVILVVDDDEAISESVADFLRFNDYDVLTAADGNEGLRIMQTQKPDLILSDISMPEVDGYQFYDRIRRNESWNTIPFIFMSARGQQHDIRLGYGMGVDAYLVKPFEVEDLHIAVQSRLKRVDEIERGARTDLEQMKQQMMSVLGHELRTPLTYLYGYLSLLKEEGDEMTQDEVQKMLNRMERGTKRLMRVVEDLLLLIRIENGAIDFEVKRYRDAVDIVPVIETLIADHTPHAEAQNVRIETQLPSSLMVYCMSPYLSDAIGRLLDNAIKFSKIEGGGVLISADQVDGSVLISIADSGLGIDPAQQSRLFKRFEQINRETMEQQGLGMGLAIAGGLIQAHNGSISVESVLDQGSTFTISLPDGA